GTARAALRGVGAGDPARHHLLLGGRGRPRPPAAGAGDPEAPLQGALRAGHRRAERGDRGAGRQLLHLVHAPARGHPPEAGLRPPDPLPRRPGRRADPGRPHRPQGVRPVPDRLAPPRPPRGGAVAGGRPSGALGVLWSRPDAPGGVTPRRPVFSFRSMSPTRSPEPGQPCPSPVPARSSASAATTWSTRARWATTSPRAR